MMKDLVRIRCCVILSRVKLLMINYYVGFLMLLMPGRQISSYLPASGSRIALTRIFLCRLFLVASLGLSSYLARFLAHLVGCPRFHFVESWIVGLAMSGAGSPRVLMLLSVSPDSPCKRY